MAHLLRSVLYPPPGHKNHLVPPPIVASSSGSNQGPRRRAAADTANARAGEPLQQPIHGRFNNPPVFFNQNPEDDQPAASGFVADSILQGFDLNKPAQTEGYDGADQDGNDAAKFVPGPNSTTSAGASNVAEEDGEEICSQPVVPFVGMMFDDLEVAKQVYNDYAWKLGFGTRIGNTKYSTARGVPKDTILSRVFECVHTGKPAAECKNAAARSKEAAAKVKEASVDMSNIGEQKSRSKQAGSEMDVNESKQRNILLRCDCKAHMVVGKRNGHWSVTVFKEEHTHPMVKLAGRRRYYRSHRKVPEEDFQFLQTLHNQNITTAQIMGCLGSVHGGDPRTLGYVKRDVSNIRTMLREEVSQRDMSMVIEYFERRKAESPNFFYDTQVDSNNAVRGLFWVDGRTRALYPKYKDCVFFDTTFCTNKYNLPFAPIVGINNHTHTIVLGCALLPDETTETFKWVFERWMLAMNQMHPDHIMTDQDQAMATAIDKHMLRSFDMAENNHLNNMWKSRKTWAPVYFRKSFFPFTSTTGRSEGLNSYFKTLVRPSDSVWNFVQQYELCQNLMLDREDNAGFTMETTTAKLWGSYSIEEQALKFYTREVFDMFQKMVQNSTRFYPIHVEAEGLCFDLVPNQDLDVKTYRVAVNPEEGLYTCGCNMFEMCGLICPHIIRVMVHLNVQQIPGRYMLERWSAAATTHAPEPGTNTIRFGVPTSNTLKYNSLCRKMNQLASDACFDDDTYVAVSRIVDEASKVVATMLKAKGQVQQEGEGRPKVTEKRRKTLVELRDEANEKRRKKQSEPKTPKEPKPKRKYRKKKCPFCGDEDHISVKDCKYMKIALAREDAMQAGADLTL
ncbi:hypothetical protein QYE76_046269 [Lolium multiflorum]|uniref:Protein FAR1-RELATED SEQUENCE n=1 Tax=Lolium multiflorum TaxID=4521 RepID=A0AAD8TPM8_LOLMU|nr:hypothetical protein QYE76_046269 [Lolium multiflorum]